MRLVDFVKDPVEENPMESWDGVEGLIRNGVENRFGKGTREFLREADRRQNHWKKDIPSRYGLRLKD